MAQLPMFCDDCGGVSLSLDLGPMVLFTGNISTPCPFCGRGPARVLEGVYDLDADSFSLLAGSDRTVEQLKRLAAILRRAQRENYTADQVVAAVDHEAPEFSLLARKLPRDNAARYAMMALWLGLIAFLADQAWNIAEYRQSERHHREAIEAAVEQTRHSSDPELDSLLRRILHQTEKGDNTATKNPAPSALAPHDNDLPKSGKKKPGHSQAGEALPAAGAGLPATDATRTRFQDEVIEGGDGPPGRESGCRNGAIDCGG